MDYKLITKKKLKEKPALTKRGSVGAELHHLDQEKSITTDPGENNKRRTLKLHKKNNSWGFTLQTYGIKHKKTNEIEIMTYVDYVEINGAAWMAGMRRGDVILSVNGEKVGDKSHQQLVNKIRQSGEVMKLVVLFEDCCRKVDLHEKYIRLKAVLKSKYQELKEIEQEEIEILNRYCESKGLNRFEQIRQSVLSHHSSSNDSWDAYSTISSPNGLSPTGHFAQNQWSSVTSLKSFSVGDNSSLYDGESSLADSELESDSLSYLGDDGTLNTPDTSALRRSVDMSLLKSNSATRLRASRASDSALYKQSKTPSPRVKHFRITSLAGSSDIVDDVFENEAVENKSKLNLTPPKEKIFYAGENGNIIVPKICIDGKEMYTTFDSIETTDDQTDRIPDIDQSNTQDKVAATDIATETTTKQDQIPDTENGKYKLLNENSDTFSGGISETNPNDDTNVAGSQDNISSNGAKNVILSKEINGARSKYSYNDTQLPWKTYANDTDIRSSKSTPTNSPKTGRNSFPGIGGSMSYEQLKSSVPDIRLSFHSEDYHVIYINETDEVTKF